MVEILFAKKSDLDNHTANTSNPHVVTAAQVSLGATDSPTFVGLTLSADLVTTSTIDGRDVAADGVTADAALPKAGGQMTGNITMAAAETVDGRDLSADGTKLDGVETGATADQTGAEIKTAYEAEANAYTDTKNTKLVGIETAATADQTNAEIKTAYEANANTNEFDDAEQTKLAGIATGAEVNPPPISQVDAEAGTATIEETFTAQRVKQAIDALGTGNMVQVVNTLTGAVATGTTVVPFDDTIPQKTEGDEYMTLAITPGNTNNILVIEVVVWGSNSAANNTLIALLAKGADADAIAAIASLQSTVDTPIAIALTHKMIAGTTSATTFKVRVGGSSAGTFTFNGQSGARRFGGAAVSSITIREYLP